MMLWVHVAFCSQEVYLFREHVELGVYREECWKVWILLESIFVEFSASNDYNK